MLLLLLLCFFSFFFPSLSSAIIASTVRASIELMTELTQIELYLFLFRETTTAIVLTTQMQPVCYLRVVRSTSVIFFAYPSYLFNNSNRKLQNTFTRPHTIVVTVQGTRKKLIIRTRKNDQSRTIECVFDNRHFSSCSEPKKMLRNRSSRRFSNSEPRARHHRLH